MRYVITDCNGRPVTNLVFTSYILAADWLRRWAAHYLISGQVIIQPEAP